MTVGISSEETRAKFAHNAGDGDLHWFSGIEERIRCHRMLREYDHWSYKLAAVSLSLSLCLCVSLTLYVCTVEVTADWRRLQLQLLNSTVPGYSIAQCSTVDIQGARKPAYQS